LRRAALSETRSRRIADNVSDRRVFQNLCRRIARDQMPQLIGISEWR
jgi:hypothetical protein